MEENLKQKVLHTIQKYNLIEENDKIVLGVSGGPDSICMLDVLDDIRKDKKINLKFDIIVAHVNHMIRKEAIDDEKYVKKICEEKNIDFYFKSIDIQKLANNMKIGTEEAGRKSRYEFFDEILENTGFNKIAIAHNKNDKIETIIMNILRGCGINGLKGIQPKREKYIRPIIECERIEIEEYCKKRNLNPKIDKTNFENIYTRNKIRNVVIPYIQEEFNPNIINTLDRLSNIVYEQEEYINSKTKEIYINILVKEKLNYNKEININELFKGFSDKEKETYEKRPFVILDLKEFNKQEEVIKTKILLYTITRIFGSSQGIEKIHVQDIIKLCSNNIGNKYLTPNKNTKIIVKNHKIYFINQV